MDNLDPILIDDLTTTPDVAQLTTRSIDGTGVFDQLMRTVKLHVTEEYDEGRITGEQYTQVYINALQAVLQQSVAFLLNHQTERKVRAEIGLIRQKTATEIANTDDTLPTGLAFNGTTAIEGLIADQKLINAQQLALITSQVETSGAEKDLVGQKIITELAQTGDSLALAKASSHGYNVVDTVAGAMTASAEKAQAEADLVVQKLVTELGQTSTTKPVDLGQVSTTTIDGIVKTQYDLAVSQKNKADEEQVLLAQKAITELAQTSDTVVTDTNALNTSTTVTGSTGKQNALYEAQTDGFARDAEQKLLKILTDTWVVGAADGTRYANQYNQLEDPNIGTVVTKAIAGITP